jgi:FkbM family methyltransferase
VRDERYRIEMTVRCRDCDGIPKVSLAGKIVVENGQSVQIMHNGLRVAAGGYYGQWMSEIISRLNGHHEPQEELVFHEILKIVSADAVMLELGGFWSYYSLWFLKGMDRRRAFVIEPDPKHLLVGQDNAQLNGATLHFEQACVGRASESCHAFTTESSGVVTLPKISVPDFLLAQQIDHLDVLHCDAQGAEIDVIPSCEDLLRRGKISFLVLSTHAQSITGDPLTHQRCLSLVQEFGGKVFAEHDVHESFSGDGLIAAYFGGNDLALPKPKMSYNRYSSSLFRNPIYDLAQKLEEKPPTQVVSPTVSRRITNVKGSLRVKTPPKFVECRENFSLEVEVLNESDTAWVGADLVFLSYHWKDLNGKIVVFDGLRSKLKKGAIAPNEVAGETMKVIAPPNAGDFQLCATLVQEHVRWFENGPFRPDEIVISVLDPTRTNLVGPDQASDSLQPSLDFSLRTFRERLKVETLIITPGKTSPFFLCDDDNHPIDLHLACDNVVTPAILSANSWQSEIVQFTKMACAASPSLCLIDVGANCGLYSRQCLSAMPGITSLHAYEPHHRNFKSLQSNLAGIARVQCANFGLFDKTTTKELYLDPENSGNYSLSLAAMPSHYTKIKVKVVDVRHEAKKWADANLPIFYKSDTQGFDERIAVRPELDFWKNVGGGIFELWRIKKPEYDMDRFVKIVESFDSRVFSHQPQVPVSTAEVVNYLQSEDRQHTDLLFWRS